MAEQTDQAISQVRDWVRERVVGWNLCPFAKREMVNDTIRYRLSEAEDEETLLADLAEEIELLDRDATIETALLIHPRVLTDFADYNDFLGLVDALLVHLERDGVYQVASFHPHYQFSGTRPEDAENYTNRSPHPLLHLLREDSMTRAVEGHPNVARIPEDNIEYMNRIGIKKLKELFPWT